MAETDNGNGFEVRAQSYDSSDDNNDNHDMQPEKEMKKTAGNNGGEEANETEDDLNGILERQAKHVARNPCAYFWASFISAIVVSAIGLVVGEFSVSANTGGWSTRGTLIADRQTQIGLVNTFGDGLSSANEALWVDLTTNIQEGQGDDDDEGGRRNLRGVDASPSDGSGVGIIESRLAEVHDFPARADSLVDFLKPQTDRFLVSHDGQESRANFLTSQATKGPSRHLQEDFTSWLGDCDITMYTEGALFENTRLWPIWKTSSSYGTALHPEVLKDLCIAEENTQKVLEDNDFCSKCRESNTKCAPPSSIVLYARYHVENGHTMSCEDLATAWAPLQADTEATWKSCVQQIKANFDPESTQLPEICPFGFSTTFIDESFDTTGVLEYTSTVFVTYPSTENVENMYDKEGSYDRGSSKISAKYDTQYEDFNNLFVDTMLTRDMSLAMASAVIVGIAILVHTRSPFLTGVGLLQIIFSFPLAFFVYKLVIGLDFFPFLNFIGVFVIFALGADDVFVAVDKWKNTRLEHPNATTEYVAAKALPDAAGAMFLTTVTTAVAFFATAICPVAPVKMFAIFCGLLVLFDYIMDVLLVFPALCLYDRYIQASPDGRPNCCISIVGCCAKKSDDDDNDAEADERPSFIRRTLLSYFDLASKLRWVLLLASVAAFGITTYFASTLELPTSSDVRLLDESYEFEANYVWRQKTLYDQLDRSGGSTAYVIWGVNPADTGDHNNPDEWSTLELDSSFDPSTTEAQEHLLGFCDAMFAKDFADKPNKEYKCSINQFHEWLVDQSGSDTPVASYTENCDGATGVPMASDKFDACIEAWTLYSADNNVLIRNSKVEIIIFAFGSGVRYDDPYDVLDDEWNEIEDWMKMMNNEAPREARRAFFSSEDFWWYDTNGKMLATAYGSAGIALGAAAAMLLLTSRSLVLTLFSTSTVAYVLVSVTATLVSLGWTLGFLESICFAILIGISCDFVLHFSHAYASKEGEVSREERTKFALIYMGPSILAGAFTTLASACIMLGTVISFFQKFAVILFMTVVQATIGCFIVFVALVLCIGPSDPLKLYNTIVGSCGGGGNNNSERSDASFDKTKNPEDTSDEPRVQTY